MRLIYTRDFLSIEEFDEVELPNFTVLTGINGAGKSHLLSAIEKKYIEISEITNPSVVHFNYETFNLENEGIYTAQQLSANRENAWNTFSNNSNQHNPIKAQIENFRQQLGVNYKRFTELCNELDKPLWSLNQQDIGNEEQYHILENYRSSVNTLFGNLGKNDPTMLAYHFLAKEIKLSLDEISKKDFLDNYKPYYLKSDFLPTQLGRIFADYYSRYEKNLYNTFRNTSCGENLEVISEENFAKLYGPKPWNIVNEILLRFSGLPYTMNSPEGLNRDDNFQVRLFARENEKISPEFSELSSGERILMALVASIFKSSSDGHFPDILLLDEIDASLHPSMIQNLIDVIQSVFIQNGVKVVLVTHSPTTIALSPGESIFIMNKGGRNRIEKKTRSEALHILTEGYATLEEGLQIFDQISRCDIAILSEGNNTRYLEKMLELFGITGVEVIRGAENRSGKEQLKVLYDFFSVVPHNRKVFVVWDCDANQYRSLEEKNNTVPFVFDRNDANTICRKGIENLFPEEYFANFQITIIDSCEHVRTEYDTKRKNAFCEEVLVRNSKADFILFEKLVDKIVQSRSS